MLCGPREARTTSDRYWVRVTSSPASASDRAAMATRTRLALSTASTTESCATPVPVSDLRALAKYCIAYGYRRPAPARPPSHEPANSRRSTCPVGPDRRDQVEAVYRPRPGGPSSRDDFTRLSSHRCPRPSRNSTSASPLWRSRPSPTGMRTWRASCSRWRERWAAPCGGCGDFRRRRARARARGGPPHCAGRPVAGRRPHSCADRPAL